MKEPWEEFAEAEPWEQAAAKPAKAAAAPAPAAAKPELPSFGGDIDGAVAAVSAQNLGERSKNGFLDTVGQSFEGGANLLGETLTNIGNRVFPTDSPTAAANTADVQAKAQAFREKQPELGAMSYVAPALVELAATGGLNNATAKAATYVAGKALPKGVAAMTGNAASNMGYEYGKGKLLGDENAGTNAALAGLFSVGGDLGMKVLTGTRPTLTQGLKRAADNGYVPTVGQQTGAVGKKAEEIFTDSKFFGGGIRKGQAQAEGTYSTAEVNEVLRHVGQRTKKQGNEARDEMVDHINTSYNVNKQFVEMPAVGGLKVMHEGTREAQQKLRQLEPEKMATVYDFVARRVAPGGRVRKIDGPEWKEIDSDIGKEAWRLKKSPDPDHQVMGDALLIFQDKLRDNVKAKMGAPKDAVERLRATDKAFRQSLAVRDATKRAIDEGGAFSPKQYAQGADRRLGENQRGDMNPEVIRTTPRRDTETNNRGGVGYAGAGMAGVAGAKLASMVPGTTGAVAALGAAAGVTGLMALSHGVNSTAGRKLILNGLAGNAVAFPAELVGKLRGMAPGEQTQALRDLMANPRYANAFTQVARSMGMQKENQNAP